MSDTNIYSQEGILDWAVETFGVVAADPRERILRFLEEALELAHACGIDDLTLHKVEARVYGRPAGVPMLEMAQCAVTLKALAEVHRVDLADAEVNEIDRVHDIPKEEWQKRHAAKTKLGITS